MWPPGGANHAGYGDYERRREGHIPLAALLRRSAARAAPLGRRSGAEGARDDHLLHLVGALADREDLGVAIEAADRILLDEAVAAVDLDGLLRAAHGQASCLELGLRSGQGEVAPGVLLARGLVDEQARGLDLGRHVGELALDGLELRDRLAECDSLLGIGQCLIE